MKYFLALDIGTSAVKAALFDTSGLQVGVTSDEYALEKPAPDLVEIDPEVYWAAAQTAMAAVLRQSRVAPEDIPAMGVTSQGETLITLDRQGHPLRKAIVWLDNRATREAAEIADAFNVDDVYHITGQQEIVPGWTAPKILWIRNNEPDVFRRAAHFLLVEDYIIYRLTGRFVSDHGINPSTLYYDLTTGDWWDDMLQFLGISRKQLPALQPSGESAGTVTANIGLSHDTRVVTTPIDQITGAVGAGNVAAGMVTETTGSALAICASCPEPIFDPEKRVGLYRHAVPESYVLLPWVPTAGMIFRWFRDELGGERSFGDLAREAHAIPPGADGLLLLPHFSGAVCPRVNPAAKGVLYGLTLRHTRAHVVRAVMESVAYMLRENLDMLRSLGVETEAVCSLGGGAHDRFWLQIKADILNRKILTVDAQEATCLGAAVLAAVGSGAYPDIEHAVKRMVKLKEFFLPDKSAVETYASSYDKYLQLNQLLLPTFGGTT